MVALVVVNGDDAEGIDDGDGGCCGSGGSCSCGAGCGNNNNYSGRGDDVGEVPSKAALLYTSGELQSSLNCT